MIDLNSQTQHMLTIARQQARKAGHVQRTQMMLFAALLAAFGIVAVAATVIATLF
jgi:hypothetical protein